MKKRGLFVGYKALFIIILLLVVPLLGISTSAATDTELANQYAPILYFEKDETCYPVDVSYHISNSYLYQIGNDNPTDTSPSIETISYLSGDYYLDNQNGTVKDDGIINDYRSEMNSLGYTVYSHVTSSGVNTVIQYWMFYAFNKGDLNQHEGDWEMVQIVLSGGNPTLVMYSQHHSGQKATWDQVERDGNHIKVYVARGSHANYLRSYSGKLGIASDNVGSNGKILQPNDYTLELLESQGWLSFGGRWGWVGRDTAEATESSVLGLAGPLGPQFRQNREMWENPVSWGNTLQSADENIFLVEMFLYNFVSIFILLTIVSLGIAIFRIYRRHKKTGLGPRIVSLLYIDGLNLKSIGNILCLIGIIVAIAGLFNAWYSISYGFSGGADVEAYSTSGLVDLIKIDGIDGIRITVPGQSGPTPIGSFSLPFSLLIAIGLVFLVIASIGISKSKKLGNKYIWRGLKLVMPIIVILIAIAMMGALIPSDIASESDDSINMGNMFSGFSTSPLGGESSFTISGTSGQIDLQWGLGLGGILLLLSGAIFIIAGILEIAAKTMFFESKVVEKSRKQKPEKPTKIEEPKKTAEEIKPLESEVSNENKTEQMKEKL